MIWKASMIHGTPSSIVYHQHVVLQLWVNGYAHSVVTCAPPFVLMRVCVLLYAAVRLVLKGVLGGLQIEPQCD
jgi:hypothetical protein